VPGLISSAENVASRVAPYISPIAAASAKGIASAAPAIFKYGSWTVGAVVAAPVVASGFSTLGAGIGSFLNNVVGGNPPDGVVEYQQRQNYEAVQAAVKTQESETTAWKNLANTIATQAAQGSGSTGIEEKMLGAYTQGQAAAYQMLAAGGLPQAAAASTPSGSGFNLSGTNLLLIGMLGFGAIYLMKR